MAADRNALIAHSEHLNDEAATLALGRRLACRLQPGLVIHLVGDLGAGKTTLVRGILAGLGHTGRVKSPTFTLVEPYNVSRIDLYHFDLYRFKDETEWLEAGFDDYFHEGSIGLVEWPEKAPHLVPPADIVVTLRIAAAGRDALIEALTARGGKSVPTEWLAGREVP